MTNCPKCGEPCDYVKNDRIEQYNCDSCGYSSVRTFKGPNAGFVERGGKKIRKKGKVKKWEEAGRIFLPTSNFFS